MMAAWVGALWECCCRPAGEGRVVVGGGDPQSLPGRFALAGLVVPIAT